MDCRGLAINFMGNPRQFVFNITHALTHSHVNAFSYHLHRALEELAEGFAFKQAVGQEGQVGELVDELFLLLRVGLVQHAADERVVDVDDEVVALRQLAVEAHAAAGGLRHLAVAAHELALRHLHRRVALLEALQLHGELLLVHLALDDGLQLLLLLLCELFGDGVVVGDELFDGVAVHADEAALLQFLFK